MKDSRILLGNLASISEVSTTGMYVCARLAIIGITLLGLTAEAQGITLGPELSPPKLEELARAVLSLQLPARSTTTKATGAKPTPPKTHVGTGFLVDVRSRLFLVTAQHVAARIDASASVTFAGDRDEPVTITLLRLLGDSRVRWVMHDTADVAVLPLKPSPENEALLLPRALPTRYFQKDLVAPGRNRPLTTIGFPLGLGADFRGPDDKLSPISRESKPASGLITLPRFDTKKPSVFFLLDSPTIGGFSGSPAFIMPGGFSDGPGITLSATVLCVGLVHGTIHDNQGGLAAIVPAAFIVETLERAHARAETSRFRMFP